MKRKDPDKRPLPSVEFHSASISIRPSTTTMTTAAAAAVVNSLNNRRVAFVFLSPPASISYPIIN